MAGGHSWELSSKDLCVPVQWNQLKGMGLYTTNISNSWQFHSFLGSGSELEFLLSVGEVKILDSAVLSAPECCSAGVSGLTLGTAGGRKVWSEEGARQGIEGLLPLP